MFATQIALNSQDAPTSAPEAKGEQKPKKPATGPKKSIKDLPVAQKKTGKAAPKAAVKAKGKPAPKPASKTASKGPGKGVARNAKTAKPAKAAPKGKSPAPKAQGKGNAKAPSVLARDIASIQNMLARVSEKVSTLR